MKKAPYINRDELVDFLKLAALGVAAREIAEKTKEKTWRQKLKCAATYCETITEERLQCITEKKQIDSILRRVEHTNVQCITSDQHRATQVPEDENFETEITINTLDLYAVIDAAMYKCKVCTKPRPDCQFKQTLYNLAVPPIHSDPAPGQCEFKMRPGQKMPRM